MIIIWKIEVSILKWSIILWRTIFYCYCQEILEKNNQSSEGGSLKYNLMCLDQIVKQQPQVLESNMSWNIWLQTFHFFRCCWRRLSNLLWCWIIHAPSHLSFQKGKWVPVPPSTSPSMLGSVVYCSLLEPSTDAPAGFYFICSQTCSSICPGIATFPCKEQLHFKQRLAVVGIAWECWPAFGVCLGFAKGKSLVFLFRDVFTLQAFKKCGFVI